MENGSKKSKAPSTLTGKRCMTCSLPCGHSSSPESNMHGKDARRGEDEGKPVMKK